jgi:hypothetical protein
VVEIEQHQAERLASAQRAADQRREPHIKCGSVGDTGKRIGQVGGACHDASADLVWM